METFKLTKMACDQSKKLHYHKANIIHSDYAVKVTKE